MCLAYWGVVVGALFTHPEEHQAPTSSVTPPSVNQTTGASFVFGGLHQHCYLGCPPGDPHMECIVTADFGVSETPALLIGFHEGGLLVRKDMADDHGGTSNECRLKEQGERSSCHCSACTHATIKVRHGAQGAPGTTKEMVRIRRSKAGEAIRGGSERRSGWCSLELWV